MWNGIPNKFNENRFFVTSRIDIKEKKFFRIDTDRHDGGTKIRTNEFTDSAIHEKI